MNKECNALTNELMAVNNWCNKNEELLRGVLYYYKNSGLLCEDAQVVYDHNTVIQGGHTVFSNCIRCWKDAEEVENSGKNNGVCMACATPLGEKSVRWCRACIGVYYDHSNMNNLIPPPPAPSPTNVKCTVLQLTKLHSTYEDSIHCKYYYILCMYIYYTEGIYM